MIVVDTSVLIDFFKGRSTAAARLLEKLEDDGTPFAIPSVCYQEVLQGARDEREWRQLDQYLGSQRLLVPEEPIALHRDAARLYFECRRRGVTVSGTVDCWVAAQALQQGGVLLHDDNDFDKIARIRPLKTLRG